MCRLAPPGGLTGHTPAKTKDSNKTTVGIKAASTMMPMRRNKANNRHLQRVCASMSMGSDHITPDNYAVTCTLSYCYRAVCRCLPRNVERRVQSIRNLYYYNIGLVLLYDRIISMGISCVVRITVVLIIMTSFAYNIIL